MRDGTRITPSGTIPTLTPDRITETNVFDPYWTGGPVGVKTTFVEAEGLTTVRVTIACSAAPARDQVLASGMGAGMAGAFDPLQSII